VGRGKKGRTPLYRRSLHLVGYWTSGRLVLRNYATGMASAMMPPAVSILDFFSDWRSPEDFLRRFGGDRAPLDHLLRFLSRRTLLERSDRKPGAEASGMDEWGEWNPAAGFLHSMSKDPDVEAGESASKRFLKWRLATRGLPPPTKLASGPAVDLPRERSKGAFPRVLLARRTWRTFGSGGVSLEDVGTLLGLTFGVQVWMDLGSLGRAALKTSPSGGARHPIEAYVAARRVQGLPRGLYHYDPDGHRLERLKMGGRLRDYLPGQPWFHEASLLVILTGVFARTQWPYPYPRSYRSVFLEAGHLSQTFCLVATWLGLAPFSTDALADSAIEKELGVDGVRESVLYAVGVGRRPRGVSWAPSVGGEPLPRLLPPKRERG
jgi:SagB-type dehydrogenase family enzyme